MNLSSIVGIALGLARLVAAVFEFLNHPARCRAAAAKAIEKEAAAKQARAEADAKAVAEGNKDEVNKRLTELLPLILVGCLLVSGCATRTIYVRADRDVVPIKHDGWAGWFVPNARMNDLLQAAQRARDLEREMAVKARMEGK